MNSVSAHQVLFRDEQRTARVTAAIDNGSQQKTVSKLATVTPIRQRKKEDTSLSSYILDRLKDDHKRWIKVMREHTRGIKPIYDTRYPHAHPSTSSIPCMFCAAVISDISTVTAATIRTLNQERDRDDLWNAEPNRQARTVMSTAISVPLTPKDLEGLYGPNWAKVMDMCYRLTDAEPEELVSILLAVLRSPRTPPPPNNEDGRDWGIPARWLAAQSLSNIPLPTTFIRTNSRSVIARVSDEVSRVAKQT